MGNRKSAAEKLDEKTLNEIAKYFSNHTASSTIKKFNINRSVFDNTAKKLNLAMHSSSESEFLKHIEKDGYDVYSEAHNAEIANYYIDHSMTCTCEEFSVKEYYVKFLLEKYNIQQHTTQEEIDLTRHQKYGFAFSKTKEEKDSLELEKYGKLGLSGKEKRHITNKKNYGVENVFANKDIIEKLEKTKLNRYGDRHFTNREKAKQTCLSKYGAETYLGSMTNANLYSNTHECSELYKRCFDDKTALESLISSLEHKTSSALGVALGVPYGQALHLLEKHDLMSMIDLKDYSSQGEHELVEFIGKDLCLTRDRTAISPYEIDIYVPSKKIGIEFNGSYWHSSIYKDKNYHFNKSKIAEKNGIRLIHIYEYEWNNPVQRKKIELMLNIALGRVTNKIYARQCDIRKISNQEAKSLNEQVHLQGHRNAQVTYGLFYKNELVQLMSFSKTKYNRNLKDDNSWEIIRGCPGSNNIVVGGVSKLFTHFIREYSPTKVFSYCDFNKFDGKSYEALGMKFIGYTGPDMKWLLQDNRVVNRSPSNHFKLKSIAKAQIFGSGSKKYV